MDKNKGSVREIFEFKSINNNINVKYENNKDWSSGRKK